MIKPLVAICCLLVSTWVHAGTVSLMQVDDSIVLEGALESAFTAMDFDPDVEFTVVVKDTQVAQFKSGSKLAGLIRSAQSKKVVFYVCEADLAPMGLKKTQLLSGVKVVAMRAYDKDGKEVPLKEVYRFYKQFDVFCNRN